MNTYCPACREIVPMTKMKIHLLKFHAVNSLQQKFRPKAVVVAEFELKHPEYFIGLECPEACNCQPCFQKALDRLVASSEAALNDCRTDSSVNDDLASHLVSKCS